MFSHRVLEIPVSPHLVLIASFLPLVVACGDAPLDPEPDELPDTAEVHGRLVVEGDSVDAYVTLTWVPGTESVVYSTSRSTGGCAIKSVDVTTGAITVLDDDCVSVPGTRNSYWRNVVVAGDGSALYYASMVGADAASAEWELRSVDLASGAVSTLRKDIVYILALSPDARNLAYVARPTDSLVVRDVTTGVETVLGGFVLPLLFSPDGTELLVMNQGPHRLSLADKTTESVSLPDTVFPYSYHWGNSGIMVLAWEPDSMQVRNLQTGGLTLFGDVASIKVQPQTMIWSANGGRVAYGIERCLDDYVPQGRDCRQERVALYVADAATGSSARVAFVRPRLGSTVFSPSGDRIVYSVNGDLYVSDVPSLH
jgi:hypothetical protein